MDPITWADFQEKLSFLATFLSPFILWFSGKFLLNKWEKRNREAEVDKAEADADKAEADAKAADVITQQKKADLVVIYEGIVRRASEEAITKSDRWVKIENGWNERFRIVDNQIVEQNKELAVIRSQNAQLTESVNQLKQEKIRMENDIKLLQQERVLLVEENANLKARVGILEKELKDNNKLIPI